MKKYLIQIGIATVIIVAIVLLFSVFSTSYTRRKEIYKTPDLSGLTSKQAIDVLQKDGYNYSIIDSSRYDPNKKSGEILTQDPLADSPIKKGRKVYLKINRSSYEAIAIPYIDFENDNLDNVSRRLKAIGFTIGEIIYKPHLGDNVVLSLSIRGMDLSPGDQLSRTTPIDIVVGASDMEVNNNLTLDTMALVFDTTATVQISDNEENDNNEF